VAVVTFDELLEKLRAIHRVMSAAGGGANAVAGTPAGQPPPASSVEAL
jgi:hypothetical protein